MAVTVDGRKVRTAGLPGPALHGLFLDRDRATWMLRANTPARCRDTAATPTDAATGALPPLLPQWSPPRCTPHVNVSFRHTRGVHFDRVCVCVRVCVPSHPIRAPLDYPLVEVGIRRSRPPGSPKDPVLICPRGGTRRICFKAPNSLLCATSVTRKFPTPPPPCFSIRARVDTLCLSQKRL